MKEGALISVQVGDSARTCWQRAVGWCLAAVAMMMMMVAAGWIKLKISVERDGVVKAIF